jgi:leader peptidase (prepilin peptidase)/N-methyltransferase
MFLVEILIILVLGLALGSFATALIYRVPRNIPWAFKGEGAYRSACPHCKTVLKPLDLIPVISWARTKGKCRHCAEKISYDYPLAEIGTLAAALAVYFALGFSPKAFFVLAALPFLIALLVIDLRQMILPNTLVFIVGAIGVVRLLVEGFIFGSLNAGLIGINYILGGFIYAGVAWLLGWLMSAILKKDALGMGDVKFFAAAGIWLGLMNLSAFCMLAGLVGVLFALGWQRALKQKIFPFGPALIVALFLLLLVEGSLLA